MKATLYSTQRAMNFYKEEGLLTKRELRVCSKKILTWMLREARGGLKATVGNRVQPDYHFIQIVFVLFCSL